MTLLVALISVRFRNMVPIINSCVQIAFLLDADFLDAEIIRRFSYF